MPDTPQDQSDEQGVLPAAQSAQEPTPEERLTAFLVQNPESKVRQVTEGKAFFVVKPWGDSSFELRVGQADDVLIAALNNLRLIPRLTAMLHTDTAALEIIWGFLPRDNERRGQQFEFAFEGHTFECAFGDASERLGVIADAFVPKEVAPTSGYRNLPPIREFRELTRHAGAELNLDIALTSFWVKPGDLPEDDLVSVLRHISFYLNYFDRHAPRILFHEDSGGVDIPEKQLRFPLGTFPDHVLGRRIDSHLLGLWESSVNSPEPFRRFLYSYQILEYVSFYHLRDELMKVIRRIVKAPDLHGKLDSAARQILDAVVEDRASEDVKLQQAIQLLVDPAIIWKEIESKKGYFSQETVFDGGFTASALIRSEWGVDDFTAAWIPKLPDALRKVRNALVHAREQRQAHSIAPTARNQQLLRPWSTLVAAVAAEVVTYSQG